MSEETKPIDPAKLRRYARIVANDVINRGCEDELRLADVFLRLAELEEGLSPQKETGLKPCPFCGGTKMAELFLGGSIFGDTYNIGCDSCHVRLISTESFEHARAKWNARV